MTAFSVFIPHAPDDRALAHLRQTVDPAIVLLFGPDLPASSTYELLINGRPTRGQIEASPHLKTLVIPWAGLPAETRELMRQYPAIAVHNLHHNAAPTAEMAIALLLAAAKFLIPSDRVFREYDWTPRHAPYPSVLLAGKTVLILGYGAVGQHVGAVCRALDMTVLAIRSRLTDTAQGVHPPDALHSLLPRANVLVICVPGTDETTNLIGKTELGLMPPGAILVNVGRGAVVDLAALYEALRSGHLHGAGLDVWYNYPPDAASRSHTPPADQPFHTLDNVVMSPHRAGGGGNPEIETLRMTALADLINRAAAGQPLPHQVDLDAGY
jgi:phosphoglycerate dehydrogenase-like enzyme